MDPCSICLDEMIDTYKIFELNCKHKFHFDCISKMINDSNKNQFKCPYCRTLISQLDVKLISKYKLIDNDLLEI